MPEPVDPTLRVYPTTPTCRWCYRPAVVTTTEGPACNGCQMGRDAIADAIGCPS